MQGNLLGIKRENPVIKKMRDAFPSIRDTYGIRKIGIFGSYARGEQNRNSDVDILVDFTEGNATFDNFMALAEDLENLLEKRVDLLTLSGVDRYIRSRVESEVIWIEG